MLPIHSISSKPTEVHLSKVTSPRNDGSPIAFHSSMEDSVRLSWSVEWEGRRLWAKGAHERDNHDSELLDGTPGETPITTFPAWSPSDSLS